jgi:hypothetical protein
MIDPVLLTAAFVFTLDQKRVLTNGSGLLFERDKRLSLVTSRHVMVDAPSKHFPDRKTTSRSKVPCAWPVFHSARLDAGARDLNLDEALGLNCAWYADILVTLAEG